MVRPVLVSKCSLSTTHSSKLLHNTQDWSPAAHSLAKTALALRSLRLAA